MLFNFESSEINKNCKINKIYNNKKGRKNFNYNTKSKTVYNIKSTIKYLAR